ncbi:acyl-CoA dehydrogenase family protein [Oleiagrimonas sp. MCCC 1A03011]|uniref:acyl-CoA dehydrogenase family protein n=1 Tax=Oleiagrimonas sp. MCCC 1A03011 TaxID=1926883 RepID=UPI000DC4ADCE|nr:acyl-CoA dehydrogenase family protein [Oleiagrimonas sp. MCCC 1A03011]RAP59318.1 acyl-CoA dehydrogenase [Oleiagrimonas sp. MCCC 1A03011]
MEFLQDAPRLPHPFHQDRLLKALIAQRVPPARRAALEADLIALGDYACMAYERRLASTPGEPVLTQWGPWGERIDRIELTQAWREGPELTTRHAVLAAGHDAEAGAHGRLEQFMRVYLYHLASEFYTCPLAMTDGAATALKAAGNKDIIARALPHFLSRESDRFWLSGQWMTETAGGSDVARTGTVARRDEQGQWRLYGRKWFTSAVVGEAALALARPEGAGEGTGGLALFYVETKDAQGRWRDLSIDRLKNKLGTRELPTAEIHLDGLPAEPVAGLDHGVRRVAPMLNVTRTWNAVCATASMARCLALASDYARRRQAFGRPLIEQPLHARTLADMQAEFEGAFALTFHVAELLGQVEHHTASPAQTQLLRLLTPLAKLWTGKLSVAIASETLECFGGAGYIEDTGLPQLLRDAQVYAIWEGTTNVLSLDTLRALSASSLDPLNEEIERLLPHHDDRTAAEAVRSALDRARAFIDDCGNDAARLQAGARGLAITLARCMAAALLAARASESPDARRPALALRCFLAHGLDRLTDIDTDTLALLD